MSGRLADACKPRADVAPGRRWGDGWVEIWRHIS
jgi:hypothetical protein